MANKSSKNRRELHFELKTEDYKAFGRYRILYTAQGRRMVRRQRTTFLITAVAIAALFTLFHVDRSFTILMYILAGVSAIAGIFFAENMLLRQQDKAIEASQASAEVVHAAENKVTFGGEGFTTVAGDDVQNFSYKDIKRVDLTEEGIYVWMSETMIMPLPRHAFADMNEMKEMTKWLRARVEEQGGELEK